MMIAKRSKIISVILIALFGILLLIPIGIFTRFVTARPPVQGKITISAGYPGLETEVSVSGSPAATNISPEVRQILEYQEALKKENLSEEMRKSLENKIEILSRVATQSVVAKAITGTPHPLTFSSRPTATFTTGLREGGTSDFHTWEAVIQNIWRQYGNNHEHIVVYAGELGSEMDYPGRGVVFVLRVTSAGRGGSFNRYLLPEGTGWVRISDIKGDYLVLTSKEGKTFYFYLPAQQFVATLKNIAPTVTPLPTPGPLPTIGPRPAPASPYPY